MPEPYDLAREAARHDLYVALRVMIADLASPDREVRTDARAAEVADAIATLIIEAIRCER